MKKLGEMTLYSSEKSVWRPILRVELYRTAIRYRILLAFCERNSRESSPWEYIRMLTGGYLGFSHFTPESMSTCNCQKEEKHLTRILRTQILYSSI